MTKLKSFQNYFLYLLPLLVCLCDSLNTISKHIFQANLLSSTINAFIWFGFVLIIYYVIFDKNNLIYKIALCVLLFKVIWTIISTESYSFQKAIIMLPFFCLFYKRYCHDARQFFYIHSRLVMLTCLFLLLTIVPFIGNYSGYKESFRFSGLWDIPHQPAYYCLAFFIFFLNRSFLFSVTIFILILVMGAKSVIIASTPLFIWGLYLYLKRQFFSAQSKSKLSIALLSLLMCTSLLISPIFINKASNLIQYHYNSLFSKQVSADEFGAGRVYLNKIAFTEIEKFSLSDIVFGRSASSLYSLYKYEELGGQWPHNDFVTIFYIYGVVGILIYSFIILWFPFTLSVNINKIWAALVTFALFTLFGTNGFFTYNSAFLILLSIGLSYVENRRSCSNI